MPIRLNLLAEAQAVEEMRRRDPVKRTIWMVAFIVMLVLCYYAYLFAQHMKTNQELVRYQSDYVPLQKPEKEIKMQRLQTGEVDRKLEQLAKMANTRFLWGSMLNAFKESAMEDVQIVTIKTEQKYEIENPPPPPGTKLVAGAAKPPPPTSIERITVTLDGRDYNPDNPIPNHIRYRDALDTNDYIKKLLESKKGDEAGVKLKSGTPPIEKIDGRSFRPLKIQILMPPKVRTL